MFKLLSFDKNYKQVSRSKNYKQVSRSKNHKQVSRRKISTSVCLLTKSNDDMIKQNEVLSQLVVTQHENLLRQEQLTKRVESLLEKQNELLSLSIRERNDKIALRQKIQEQYGPGSEIENLKLKLEFRRCVLYFIGGVCLYIFLVIATM